jgi:hypothetical protein
MAPPRPRKTGFKKVDSMEDRSGLPPWVLVLLLAALGAGFWGWRSWQRVNAFDGVLQACAAQQPAQAQDAADLARAIRTLADQNGVTLLDKGVTVTIPAADGAQAIPVQVRTRATVLGLRVVREFSAVMHGGGLVASTYVGDGLKAPEEDGMGRERLERALKKARCPAGTVEKGAAPPQGFETWCELPGKPVKQHGPYVGWHTSGQVAEEGAYADGKREGKWTRYHADGTRAAEAFYRAGVQDGRFRTWDREGKLLQDQDYRGGVPTR